jgi:hypothetical protein
MSNSPKFSHPLHGAKSIIGSAAGTITNHKGFFPAPIAIAIEKKARAKIPPSGWCQAMNAPVAATNIPINIATPLLPKPKILKSPIILAKTNL